MPGHEEAWADALSTEHLHQRELLATVRGELGTFACECASALTALDTFAGLAGVNEILSTAQAGAAHAKLALDVGRRLRGGEDPQLVDVYSKVAGGEDVPPALVRHASDVLRAGPRRTDRQLLEAVVTASGASAQIEQLVGPAPWAALAAMKPLLKWVRTDDRKELLHSAGSDLAQVLTATASLGAGAETAAAGDAAAIGQSLRDSIEHVENAAKAVREGKLEAVLREARQKLQQDLDALRGIHEGAHDAPAEWREARKVEHAELTEEVRVKLEKIERIRGVLLRLLPNLQAITRALGVIQKVHALEGRLDPAPAAGVAAAQAALALHAGDVWAESLPGAPPAPRVRRVSKRTKWIAAVAAVAVGAIVGIALAGGSSKPKAVVTETNASAPPAPTTTAAATPAVGPKPSLLPVNAVFDPSQRATFYTVSVEQGGEPVSSYRWVADDAAREPDLQQVRTHPRQAEPGGLAPRRHGRLHAQRDPARRHRPRDRPQRPLVVLGVVLRNAHEDGCQERALRTPVVDWHTCGVEWERRQRWLARIALALLALVAELAGRSLAHRLDVGRHVGRVSYAHADYYPFLLAAVKVGIALMLARLVWRFAKARRVASLIGASPRVRVELSARLWLASFAATSVIYLVQTDAEGAASGRWPLLAPWLHSSALPVFAVLSVLVALLFRSVELWLRDYERLAAHAAACLRRLRAGRLPLFDLHLAAAPRRLFGLAFESRPPPLAA